MTEKEIYSDLSARFGEKLVDFQQEETFNPTVVVQPGALKEVMTVLKDSENFQFDALMCLSGHDPAPEEQLNVIYHLYSTALNHYITVKVMLDREHPVVDSLVSLYGTADWHEREVYDMFGIEFSDHPNLKRILTDDDWEGFPLRKDYVPAEFYRGMKIAKEK